MMGEIDIAGIFVSPLLICMLLAFSLRIIVSRLLDCAGFYRVVWQRPLFDTALFLILTGAAFQGLRLLTQG